MFHQLLFRPTRKQKIIIKLGLFLMIALMLFVTGRNVNYSWQWERLAGLFFPSDENYGISFFSGLMLTLLLSLVCLLLTLPIGILTALLRLSHSRWARVISRSFVEIIRNTPLLIQISIAYFAIAPFLNINGYILGILAIALFEGAYTSEILRSGILAIPKGQWEASHALNITPAAIWYKVILPQAIRNTLPILVSQCISLVKDTSLLYIISVVELTYIANNLVARTYMPFEIWIVTALLYLSINTCLSIVVRKLEKRRKHG